MGGAGVDNSAGVFTEEVRVAGNGVAVLDGTVVSTAAALGASTPSTGLGDIGTTEISPASALESRLTSSGRARRSVFGSGATAAGGVVGIEPRVSAAGSDGMSASGRGVGSNGASAPDLGVARSAGISGATVLVSGSAALLTTWSGATAGAGVRQSQMPSVGSPRHPKIPATSASRRVRVTDGRGGIGVIAAGSSGSTATPRNSVATSMARRSAAATASGTTTGVAAASTTTSPASSCSDGNRSRSLERSTRAVPSAIPSETSESNESRICPGAASMNVVSSQIGGTDTGGLPVPVSGVCCRSPWALTSSLPE